VVFQFTLSIVVIASAFMIQSQLDFLQNQSLGYEDNDLITVRLRGDTASSWEDFKDEVLKIPGVELASAASGTPVEAMISMYEPVDAEPFRLYHYFGDTDYIKTMGYELVAGRDFSSEMGTDAAESVVVNEAAVRGLGLTGDPIGKKAGEKTIIGVVRDFQTASLREEISPALIAMDGMRKSFLIIRVNPARVVDVVAGISQIWNTRSQEYPFEYTFQDDKLTRQYSSEERLGQFFNLFSFLVIAIACMGLFGLAEFMTKSRTREIGIRKVMGASVRQVVVLLSRDITFPVIVAIFIGAPIAYFAADAWLAEFAYHVSISGFTILASGILLLIVAWLTVSARTLRAASVNPVDSLRGE
jgi:putative ABC transport system permease protein